MAISLRRAVRSKRLVVRHTCRSLSTERPQKTFLVLKTETTGLPLNINAPVEAVDNWPRLVSLKWRIYATNGDLMGTKGGLIQPSGFKIPPEVVAIHGISTDQANMYGSPIQEVICQLLARIFNFSRN